MSDDEYGVQSNWRRGGARGLGDLDDGGGGRHSGGTSPGGQHDDHEGEPLPGGRCLHGGRAVQPPNGQDSDSPPGVDSLSTVDRVSWWWIWWNGCL